MGLAQQVQTSVDESRSARLTQRSRKQNENFNSNSFTGEKRLLTGRRSNTSRPKLLIDEKPTNKNQDTGIWVNENLFVSIDCLFSFLKLLPILCYTLQVDNIFDAQEWLLNANATGLISILEIFYLKNKSSSFFLLSIP